MMHVKSLSYGIGPETKLDSQSLIMAENKDDDSYDFKKARMSGAKIVDKSLLIAKIIDDLSPVKLILRPNGFGKSFNLSMLKYYYAQVLSHRDKNNDNKQLFESLEIWKTGDRYRKEQGQYYVVFLDFKNIKMLTTVKQRKEEVKKLIRNVYKYFESVILSNNSLLRDDEQTYYKMILEDANNTVNCDDSLLKLTKFLYQQGNNREVILLIDEYDAPFIFNDPLPPDNYSEDIQDFMIKLLAPVLKDNKYLKQAIMMGVSRGVKDSILSGLNNIRVYNVLSDPEYSKYFGFTSNDIRKLIPGLSNDMLQKIQDCYGGIRVDEEMVFNSKSIIEFLKHNASKKELDFEFCPYVERGNEYSTVMRILKGNNLIVKEFQQALVEIQEYGSTLQMLEPSFDLAEIEKDKTAFFSYLLMTGYFTVASAIPEPNQHYQLYIPNDETQFILKEIFDAFSITNIESASYHEPNDAEDSTLSDEKHAPVTMGLPNNASLPGIIVGPVVRTPEDKSKPISQTTNPLHMERHDPTKNPSPSLHSEKLHRQNYSLYNKKSIISYPRLLADHGAPEKEANIHNVSDALTKISSKDTLGPEIASKTAKNFEMWVTSNNKKFPLKRLSKFILPSPEQTPKGKNLQSSFKTRS